MPSPATALHGAYVYSDEELLMHLKAAKEKLGYWPTSHNWAESKKKYAKLPGIGTYIRRMGGLVAARALTLTLPKQAKNQKKGR